MLRTEFVAPPEMVLPSKVQLYVSGVEPSAPTVRLKGWPARTFLLSGWLVMIGGTSTVTVKVQLALFVPYLAVQVTVLVPPGKPDPEGGELVKVATGVPTASG